MELMTHNQHHAHNPHAGHVHDQRTGADTTIGASSARSGHTSTEHLPPCQVARAVREATVLVTPHGFQSILTLLQPPKSLLVEVFPYGYNKPEIYGLIQAGMRAYRYGKQRSYLHAESPPTRLLPRLMHSLRLLDDPFINGVTAHTGRSEQETRAALEAQLWHLPDRLRDNETAITETMQRLRRVEQDAHREELYHTPGRWHLFSHAACTANPLCRRPGEGARRGLPAALREEGGGVRQGSLCEQQQQRRLLARGLLGVVTMNDTILWLLLTAL